MKNKKLMLIPMLILVFSLMAGTALAAGTGEIDTAGNLFLGCDDPASNACISTDSAQRDIYWMGNNLDLSGSLTGGDVIAAGYSIAIADSDFGGSIRTAGYNVNITNSTAANNITAAGYSVTVGKGVKAAGAILIGNDVTFSGECDHLSANGTTVRVSGVVNGDAQINANKVIFSDDAVITGHLSISAATEPTYPAGIKDYTFTAFENTEAGEAMAAAEKINFGALLLGRLYWIVASVIVALLLCLVGAKELDKSGKTLLQRPVAMPVTGLVTLIAMPVALILLLVTVIGAPVTGLIALLFAAMCFFAVTFAGASAGRLVFPNMNKVLASVIGVAALELLRIVPYFGELILFAAILYTVGYFILACYDRIKALKAQPETADAPAAVSETGEN